MSRLIRPLVARRTPNGLGVSTHKIGRGLHVATPGNFYGPNGTEGYPWTLTDAGEIPWTIISPTEFRWDRTSASGYGQLEIRPIIPGDTYSYSFDVYEVEQHDTLAVKVWFRIGNTTTPNAEAIGVPGSYSNPGYVAGMEIDYALFYVLPARVESVGIRNFRIEHVSSTSAFNLDAGETDGEAAYVK